MAEEISLDAQGLQSALAILQREQTAYLPTERQYRLYRWFNVCAYTMTGAFALALVAIAKAPEEPSRMDEYQVTAIVLSLVATILMGATIILFFLNWGLIAKLHRQAQLRRRLKLVSYFAPAFSAERRTTRALNALTLLISAVGALFILSAIIGSIGSFVSSERHFAAGQAAGLVTGYTVMLLLGVSFVSLFFMRRGKQRLDIVLRLQSALGGQRAQAGEAKEVKVSADDYNAIAALERQQIIRERAESIASGRKEAEAAAYVCQSSRQMHEAKSRLPPEVLVKVEGTIAELLANPAPAAAAAPDSATRAIPVAGTALKIQYDVDAARHLVRLHDLEEAAVAGKGVANGLS